MRVLTKASFSVLLLSNLECGFICCWSRGRARRRRGKPRNLDRMPTLSPVASKARQGLPLGLSVEHRGGAWEAWTLGQSWKAE